MRHTSDEIAKSYRFLRLIQQEAGRFDTQPENVTLEKHLRVVLDSLEDVANDAASPRINPKIVERIITALLR